MGSTSMFHQRMHLGFAVIDGNEKINRSTCAAPKSKVSLPHQYIYMTSMCTRSPATGGKHQSTASIIWKNFSPLIAFQDLIQQMIC